MADTEKSLGRKLLGFFIKEPESTPPTPSPEVISETRTQAPPGREQPASPQVPQPLSTSVGEVDQRFVDHFADLLEKANLPGPDYFEFKQALKSMEGLGLNEEKQFQASWASFRAMATGMTDTSVLTTSANHYGEVLNKDRESFLKDVERAIDERIGSLKQEADKLQKSTKSCAQQIVELQKKIDTNDDRLENINDEIEEQTSKITTSRDSFDLTYQSMVDQINADIEKIKRYLG